LSAAAAGTPTAAFAGRRPFALREMLEILFRDRWRIAGAFMATFAVFVIASFLVPRHFTSDASLLVRLGQEYVYVAEASGAATAAMPMSFSREETLSAETEILSSREVIRGAIQRVGLSRLYPRLAKGDGDRSVMLEKAVERIGKDFSAELVEDSTVLRLSFRHPDPRLARQGLHALVESYLERRRIVFSDVHVRFLGEQLAQAGQRLAEAEAGLAQFKREHDIVNYEQQLSLLVQQANEVEFRLNDSGQQVEAARARAGRLRELSKQAPANRVVYSESLGDPQTAKQLLDLRLKEQALSARYQDTNPLVRNARKELAAAESFLSQQKRDPPKNVRTARNQVLEQAELDLMRAASEESALAGGRDAMQVRLQQIQQRAEALSDQQAHFNVLALRQKLMEESYGNYARRLEGARVDEARGQRDRTNVNVLQDASQPRKSTSVRKPLLLVGLFFSVGMALVVAFLSEALRTCFQLPGQLERQLGIPVLASLPRRDR
jgi:uncharacterized protein involved in exopolysaccharide biosynthesis